MSFQSVDNVAEARLFYNCASGPDVITSLYFWDNTIAWDAGALSDLVDQVHGWWDAEVKPLQHSAWVLAKIVAKDLEDEFPYSAETSYGEAGTRAGAVAPASIAALVHFKGSPGNPPRSGTIFHPGIAEADIDGNLITNGYRDAVQAAYDGARSMGGAPITQDLVIITRYHGTSLVDLPNGEKRKRPVKRGTGLHNTIVETTVPNRYGIQKRRRPSPL